MAGKAARYELNRVNHFVLHKQHLAIDSRSNDILRITRDIGGLHATSPTTPYLSLLARMNAFDKKDLEKELYRKKNLARIRYVRKTLYILPKEKVPVAFASVSKNTKKMTELHLQYLGLTLRKYEKVAEKILSLCQKTGQTISGLKAELGAVPNLSYILRMMCFQGLLIRGKPQAGWKSNLHTYSAFSTYYPDVDLNSLGEKEAQEQVIKSYIASFGPVTESDIAWWTGFTKGAVRTTLDKLGRDVTKVQIEGADGEFFLFFTQEKALKSFNCDVQKTVNILPCLDPYLMGYRDRDRYLSQKYFEFVYDRSGNATSSILCGGEIIGVWDFLRPHFKYYLFEDAEEEVIQSIHTLGKKTGFFISGEEVRVRECCRMIPLPKRTAGGFMTPLKDC